MTYRELAEKIAKMNEYQKGCDVTIDQNHEYHSGVQLRFVNSQTEDRLDDQHPYLVAKGSYPKSLKI